MGRKPSSRTQKSPRVGRDLQPSGHLKLMALEIFYKSRAVYAYIVVLKAAGCDVPTAVLSLLSAISRRSARLQVHLQLNATFHTRMYGYLISYNLLRLNLNN